MLAVERPAPRCGRVVDDALKVAVATHEWRQQLLRAVDSLDANLIGPEHEHIRDTRVAQHGEQSRQAEHFRHDQLAKRDVFVGSQRCQARRHPLASQFRQHLALDHVTRDLFTKIALGSRLAATGHRKAIAPLPTDVDNKRVEFLVSHAAIRPLTASSAQ